MLMYTSCGWFFDELSGIETVQVIQYAARAIQLYGEVFGESIEEPFLQKLELAKSNVAANKDGRDLQQVRQTGECGSRERGGPLRIEFRV